MPAEGSPDRRVRGVLFDVDGTLVDSTYFHTISWWQALRQSGRDVPMARIHRAIGMGAEKLIPELIGPVDADQQNYLTGAHDSLYSSFWTRLRPLPGARDLIERCRIQGLTTVLASSAGKTELQVLRSALDADEYIDAATSSDDADASKPAPDIVTAALDKAGLTVDGVVFVGDAVWDVFASAKLSIPCIGLECGGTSRAELLDAGAVAVYQDPADLLGAFERSVLGAR
jgi:HAD superfamily hydrolase (TIGR01509 family)